MLSAGSDEIIEVGVRRSEVLQLLDNGAARKLPISNIHFVDLS